jgi:V8-like Glu-specific endopeptidase
MTSTRRGIRSYSTRALIDYAKKRVKLIYGVDDRKDYYELESEQKQECDGVVSLFEKSDIQEDESGKSRIQTSKFAEAYDLCEQEIFRNQPVGAFCSGFLVAQDIVATAGHCVNKTNVTDVCFVFGYRMDKSNQAQTSISSSEIYRGKEIIGRKLEDGNGSDWCLVRLDRPVDNHKIFDLRRSGKIENGEKVHVIGHPCGLPLKYAGGAWVRDNEDDAYFVANLDTYGGNSGSCVLSDKTGKVEGILVRGDTDFVSADGCNVSNVCPTTGCRGEDVTRTTEFADLVPEQ